MHRLRSFVPALDWGRRYDRAAFGADALAAVIVTIMLVPQSLAYAMLAGLPPEAGLYASILPIVLYALFGTSRTLAVGPVAVLSLMTAAAAGRVAEPGSPEFVAAALVLALLSGAMLLAMGVLRLGVLANFLGHPVISGFITASGILIAASQLRHVLGIEAHGHTLPELALSLGANLGDVHGPTLAIGAGALGFLFWVRRGLGPLLRRLGVAERPAAIAVRVGPILAVAGATLAVWMLRLDLAGVRIVGDVPAGLPPLTLPRFAPDLWLALAGSAAAIAVIGFVESVSVAQTLAAKRRERIDPDGELIGLGAANIGAAFTGGFPVTGGFARSVVNFDAGAATQAAGILTALGLLGASLFLTPLLHYLPDAVLAATIIVAVLSLVDLAILRRAWAYSGADFAAVAVTILATLLLGVEPGVAAGVLVSLATHLWRTSRPHVAVVGRVPGTEHFRNVERHHVETDPAVLSVRIDESLYFANAQGLEAHVLALAAERPALRHVVLMCSAVNAVDLSALESLEALVARLRDMGVALHLSEVKGPVMDRLARTDFLAHLTGQVFLSQSEAARALSA
ncbi:SulP family inorganic anion transporter [Jannaschia sp. W003]|uniref:SulP family inorganic anion transporter n=1 Tax=Jannaschia sp. W003 TaxID=2867012 RepID=UPI0021A64E8A|nr:sulfate permease [Jannaschia sp. W003]UWQ22435.1 sulfate permease [Jannaschia sp. W003]